MKQTKPPILLRTDEKDDVDESSVDEEDEEASFLNFKSSDDIETNNNFSQAVGS